jgi:hypothetical protein
MKKEVKVYIIDCSQTKFDFRGAEQIGEYDKIKDEAERLGSVYSLEGFQDSINDEDLFLNNSFILIN